MLKDFRGAVKGIGAWILVALFVLAFGVVGVPTLSNFRATDALSVAGNKVSLNDLEREFTRRMERERLTSGKAQTRGEAIASGLLAQTLGYFTLSGLYEAEAKALGLTATDAMIQAYLQADENLKNPTTGKFDTDFLGRILQANRLSLPEFRERVRVELLQRQLDDALALTGPAPEAFARYFVLRQTEERTVAFARLPAPPVATPTDEELVAFHAGRSDNYQSPEYRSYTLVVLDRDTVADRVQVDEEEVKALYAARAATLGRPEQRNFVQALFADRATADAAHASIRGGANFSETAAALGGSVTAFDAKSKPELTDKAVADAVFGIAAPGLVGPVDGTFGVVIAEVSAIEPGVNVSYEEARAGLAEELTAETFEELIDTLYNEIQEAGDSGTDLAEAASAAGLTVRVVGPVDADLVRADLAIEDAVPTDVHARAFALKNDGTFDAVDLPEGGYGFIQVTEITPAAPRPYADVAADVALDYAADALRRSLDELKARFDAELAGGKDFAAAVSALGGTVTARTLSPLTPTTDLSDEMLEIVYGGEIGKAVSTREGTALLVAMTQSITYGANAQAERFTNSLRVQLGQTLGRDYYDAYMRTLETEHGVKRNAAEIAKRFGAEE